MKNKQELIFLCHDLAFDIEDEAMEAAIAEGTSNRARLGLTIRKYIYKLTDELGGGALMTNDAAMSPEHLQIITERRRKWDAAFRNIVTGAIEEGHLRKVDPKLTEFFIMGAIRGLHRWFSPSGEKSGEQITEELVTMIFKGDRRMIM